MRIDNDTVSFDNADMHFVKRFGIEEATDMVLNYSLFNKTPFIYDIYQLSSFLCLRIDTIKEILDDISSNYTCCKIPKKTGGFRTLEQPNLIIDSIQRKIYERILKRLHCSPYATAYHPGAHLTDNAAPHTGKRYLLKMDITDFFGSIRFDMIVSSVFNTSLYPKHIGAMLSAFCCLEDVLPQGTCTSPALSNLVMKHFDDAFGAWCRRHQFNYTRYSDDITVSGNTSLYPAFCVAKDMLSKMGFELNEKKTHFVTNASCQMVTGLTVNEKVSVNSEYKQKLRQELYYVSKFGFQNVIERQQMKEYINKANPQKGYAAYYYSLMGRIDFVLSVEPDNAYFVKAKENLNEKMI